MRDLSALTPTLTFVVWLFCLNCLLPLSSAAGVKDGKQASTTVSPLESKGVFTAVEKDLLLKYHNAYRGGFNASNMIKLEWDAVLEKTAQKMANSCAVNTTDPLPTLEKYSSLGMNNLMTSERSTVISILKTWYKEKDFYTYSNNTCINNGTCNNYTQMVWASSQGFGCAMSYCGNMTDLKLQTGYAIVCVYSPGGNIEGGYPYLTTGKPCSKCQKKFKYCVDNLCSMSMGKKKKGSGKSKLAKGMDTNGAGDLRASSWLFGPLVWCSILMVSVVKQLL